MIWNLKFEANTLNASSCVRFCLPLHYSRGPVTSSTHSCQWPHIPISLCWMRKRGLLVETSELASRLILLIQISSHGNCCIDWTTKAWRKTLQHSIIHTDRHNAIPLLPLSLPPPPPLLLSPVSVSLSLFLYWKNQWGRRRGADKQAGVCADVCVCYLIVILSLSESRGVFGCFWSSASVSRCLHRSLFIQISIVYFNIYRCDFCCSGEIVLIPLLCIK